MDDINEDIRIYEKIIVQYKGRKFEALCMPEVWESGSIIRELWRLKEGLLRIKKQ